MSESLKINQTQWLVNIWIIRLIRVAILILGWSSIIITLILSVGNPDILSAYTIQSNLIVMIWLSIALFFQERKKDYWFFKSVIRGAITLYITITFLVFAILLSPYYQPTGIGIYTNLALHYLIPIAFIVDWVFTELNQKYSWKYIVYWLCYPILYLIFTLIRGIFTGDYIYPFLDLESMGVNLFIIWVFILTAVFLLFGSVFIFLNKKIGNRIK